MAELSLDELTQLLEAPAVSPEGGRARGYQSPQQWRQQLALDALEDRENLPRGLLTGVLTRESNGYPAATSPKGAQGLFQFMPATARAYKIDPANPAQAADAAAKELGSHYKRYGGDLPQTLAAWNWGSGNLQKQGIQHAPQETRNFITWVSGLLSPRSAEAAERLRTPGASPAQTPTGPLTLESLEHLLGTPTQGAQQGAGRPQPPVPVQTPPMPLVDPAARQEPPSVSPRTPSDLVIDIEKPTTAQAPPPRPADPLATLAMGQGPPATAPLPQPVTDPAAHLATAGGPGGSLKLNELPWWAKAGVATGIGALGSGGGAALGALGGPLAPLTIPLGEIGGSWLARKLNVELGLEEPGIVGDVASVAVPAVLRGAGALWRGGLRTGAIPGTGPIRHEMAQEAAEGLARTEPVERMVGGTPQVVREVVEGRLMPPTPAAALWQQATQHNATIPTVGVWRTAKDVLESLNVAPSTTASHPGRQAAEDFFTLARRYGGPVPLQELDRLRKAIGPNAGRYPEVARIYGAILDDMEHAAARNIPGAGPLRQAIATTRREHALDKLADLWAPGKGIQQTGETTQVYGKRIQHGFERLMNTRLFRGAWSPEEVADIRQTLQTVNRLSHISLASGGTLTRQLSRHGVAAGAGVLGWAQGGPEQGAAYAMTVEAFPYVMTFLLGTTAGRAAIRNAITRGGGRIGPAEMGALVTAAREAGQGSGVMPTETPGPAASGARP